jgi:hypothetical protein
MPKDKLKITRSQPFSRQKEKQGSKKGLPAHYIITISRPLTSFVRALREHELETRLCSNGLKALWRGMTERQTNPPEARKLVCLSVMYSPWSPDLSGLPLGGPSSHSYYLPELGVSSAASGEYFSVSLRAPWPAIASGDGGCERSKMLK